MLEERRDRDRRRRADARGRHALAGLPAELPAHLAAELVELIDDAERYAAAAQAVNTTRAYASDWKQFTGLVRALPA